MEDFHLIEKLQQVHIPSFSFLTGNGLWPDPLQEGLICLLLSFREFLSCRNACLASLGVASAN